MTAGRVVTHALTLRPPTPTSRENRCGPFATDLTHHPDDGPQPERPNPSLARDVTAALLLFLIGCTAPLLAVCVAVGR